jgi:Family of unknown function (DUF6157)
MHTQQTNDTMSTEKVHTTNYQNTFIEVAEDTKVSQGTPPLARGEQKTLAQWQYELLVANPYKFTSDDVFFMVYAHRNDLVAPEYDQARKTFFSKGQPCFRSSPLTKTHGFGVHANEEGRVAIFGMETEPYQRLLEDPGVKKVKAMRNSKK